MCQMVEISRRGRLSDGDRPLVCIPIRDEKCHVCCAAGLAVVQSERRTGTSVEFFPVAVDRDGANAGSENSRPLFPSVVLDRDVNTSTPTNQLEPRPHKRRAPAKQEEPLCA